MTDKADMIQRQRDMLKQLDNNTFNKQTYLTKHHILDRTLRRDLQSLADRGEIFESKFNILRKKCLSNLTAKVAKGELSDALMANIVMSGITKKTAIDADLNITGLNEGIQTLIKFSKDDQDES